MHVKQIWLLRVSIYSTNSISKRIYTTGNMKYINTHYETGEKVWRLSLFVISKARTNTFQNFGQCTYIVYIFVMCFPLYLLISIQVNLVLCLLCH